jgi:hypothetical protein
MRYVALLVLLLLCGCAQQQRDLPSSVISSAPAADRE